MGLFSLMLALTAVLFEQTVRHWRAADSSDVAQREMRKAQAALQRDATLTSSSELGRARVPGSLAGDDGEALWFLSPIDPATKQAVHRADGTPFWQRNILYYLVVPVNECNCAGLAAPDGYESGCPHKVLVRKVIDSAAPTVPTDESTLETLLADVTPFLTRPVGNDPASISEAGVEDVRIVATHLLRFESATGQTPDELAVSLRAVLVDQARRDVPLGSTNFLDTRYTRQLPFFVTLHNASL